MSLNKREKGNVLVMEKKRKLATNLAYIFGGLGIAGALTSFLAGFLFSILGMIASIIAMKKNGENYKVLIPWSIGMFLNIIVLIFVIVIGPLYKI